MAGLRTLGKKLARVGDIVQYHTMDNTMSFKGPYAALVTTVNEKGEPQLLTVFREYGIQIAKDVLEYTPAITARSYWRWS